MGLHAGKLPAAGGMGPKQAPMEEGTSKCRVVQIIDLGVQPQRPHEGKPKPPVHMIKLTYEFTDEFCLDEDGNEMEDKPRWLAEEIPLYPLSSDLAKSTKRYKAMDPECIHGGDFTMMGGAPVNVTVVNNKDRNGKKDANGDVLVYNNIGAVTSMKKKEIDKLPELVNKVLIFSRDEATKEEFEALPNYLKEKVKAGLDFAGCPLDLLLRGEAPAASGSDEEEDDVPEGDKKPW